MYLPDRAPRSTGLPRDAPKVEKALLRSACVPRSQRRVIKSAHAHMFFLSSATELLVVPRLRARRRFNFDGPVLFARGFELVARHSRFSPSDKIFYLRRRGDLPPPPPNFSIPHFSTVHIVSCNTRHDERICYTRLVSALSLQLAIAATKADAKRSFFHLLPRVPRNGHYRLDPPSMDQPNHRSGS